MYSSSPIFVYYIYCTKPIRSKIHAHEKFKFRNFHADCAPRTLLPDLLGRTMDTAAYLTSQGWAGHGHALHHSGRGIIKPIAVTQKNNVLGVGKKKHDAHADQWWARAFDETLKGINATKDDVTGTTEGLVVTGAAKQAGSKMRCGVASVGHGLYSCFVKGEGLGGTLERQNLDIGAQKENGDASPEELNYELENDLVPSLRKDEVKRKKKKRKPEHRQGTEVVAPRRDREDDQAEEDGQAVNAAPKEKKEKRKKRKDIDNTDKGQEPPRAELTEQERRKRRKKARKEGEASAEG